MKLPSCLDLAFPCLVRWLKESKGGKGGQTEPKSQRNGERVSRFWLATRGAAWQIRRATNWFVVACWHFVLRRVATAERFQIVVLEDRLSDQERRIGWLQQDLLVRDRHIEQLAEIIARDRERVKAETAILARKGQDAINLPQYREE